MKNRFLKIAALTVLSVLAVVQLPCAAETAGQEGYVVKLTQDADLSSLSFRPELLGNNVYAVSTPAQVRELGRLGAVECVTRDAPLTIQDAYPATDWNMVMTGAESAWNHKSSTGGYNCRGDGVIVAVIDSGVAPHEDLNTHNLLPVESTYEGYTHEHGTFVAGIIAAQLNHVDVDGVAPNVRLLPLCITDEEGNTSDSRAIAAINYAVKRGADVINLSLSGYMDNPLLEEACQYAVDQGVIVVSCAGNTVAGKQPILPRYPAAYDCVISVSACQPVGENMMFAYSFSCYGDTVDVCAPGANITSLKMDGGTTQKNGTSFSSPMVAAMAALARQQDPALDSEGFLALLQKTSTDLGEPGKDPLYGFGVINIDRFVQEIMADQPEDQPPEPAEDENPFVDVAGGDYFYDAVGWAVQNGVTTGSDATHFSPAAQCTRAQMVTFLYRAAGSPEVSLSENPFTDVKQGAYYYDAVLWAYENGITTGVSETKFGVDRVVSREQVVTFLWRFAGQPEAAGGQELLQSYRDQSEIAAYAREAFVWAVSRGITSGTSGTTLSPGLSCLRGQIVTFLYRLTAETA